MEFPRWRRFWFPQWLLLLVCPSGAWAQRAEMQVIAGSPFGVAVISLPAATGGNLPDRGFPTIEDSQGRVRYPVFSGGRLARLLGTELAPGGENSLQAVLFLFRGDGPLQVTVSHPTPTTYNLVPERLPPRFHQRLLQRWWRDYYAACTELGQGEHHLPLVPDYLTGMLGQRLGLRPPLLARLQAEPSSDVQKLFDLLLGTERLQRSYRQEMLAGGSPVEPANQPLPVPYAWRPPQLEPTAGPDVEPLAQHVPAEAFYVRFGTFENYLWLEGLMTSYGGDLGRMVTTRGHEVRSSDRVRQQLALPQSDLAKLFGGTLIQDIALIGTDLYLDDGAAIGVVLHARNSTLLSLSIQQQRSALAASKTEGATLENLTTEAGKKYSSLTTPDNRVRSFYAVDGDFHLVTTSRALAERFLDVNSGAGSLAKTAEFRHARALHPHQRNDAVFSFLSPNFLQGLFSPQYQVELSRRLRAKVQLDLVQCAQLAARGEGEPADTLENLIAAGFLPPGFGRQPDGSGPILEVDRVLDSLRGARGTFLPIPDVEIRGVTTTESASYTAHTLASWQNWERLDPVMAAIRREPQGERRERVTVLANISPLAEEKYGWILSLLGPPVTQQIAPRPGDVVAAQAYVTGGNLSQIVPPHLLFVGIQDLDAPVDLSGSGLWQWLKLLRSTPGYLGAWPKPGFLDWLPLRGDREPPAGFSRLLFEVWRWQADDFSVLSFQLPVLESVAPQLQVVESPNPAQIRVQIGDLNASRLRDFVQKLYYARAWQTSVANAALLETLVQQLRVPSDEALAAAEKLLDTKLVCPLGGTYERRPVAGGRQGWCSTAWPATGPGGNAPPPDYQAPLLVWFRGLELSLAKLTEQLEVEAVVDLQR